MNICVFILITVFVFYSSIERSAAHEAKRTEQKARGELERQKLQSEKVVFQLFNCYYYYAAESTCGVHSHLAMHVCYNV